jgi:hypothetical protein
MTVGYGPPESTVEGTSSNAGDGAYYHPGYPVWSSSSSDTNAAASIDRNGNNGNGNNGVGKIAGVETHWNAGLIIPPLQGWTGSVNPRFTAFVMDFYAGNDTTAITFRNRRDLVTLKGHPSSLYFMEGGAGLSYVLVNYVDLPGWKHRTLLCDLDGQGSSSLRELKPPTLWDENDYDEPAQRAIPSPDGSTICVLSWKSVYERAPGVDYFAYQMFFRVAFVDAATLEVVGGGGDGPVVEFDGVVGLYGGERQWPFFYWDGDGAFRLTDMRDFNVAVVLADDDGGGTMLTLRRNETVPSCVPVAATSSGPISPDGSQVLVVRDGAIESYGVVAADPPPPYCSG